MPHPFFLALALTVSIIHVTAFAKASHAAEPSALTYTLDEIITLALERNPAVMSAEGAVRQSQGDRVRAGAYPNPSIIGSSGRGAIRDPSTGVAITERTVTVEQPLEWPSTRQARQRAAEAGIAGAHAGVEETRLKIIADVKVAFYQLLLAQRDAELATQNLKTVEAVAQVVKDRVALGEGGQFQVIKANVEVQKARKEVARAVNALQVAQVNLDTLTGKALGKPFRIQGDFTAIQQEQKLESLIAVALTQNPSLRRQRKLIDQAELKVVQEKQSRIPNFTISGTYHREAGDEAILAGVSVPVPLWYRRQGEIETALGTQRRSEAEWLQVRNELERAITQHFQEARTAQEQIAVFEQGLLKQAEEALDIAKFSFQHGEASLLEVLDAQRVYRQTLLEYAQARSELAIALARLERWTGGGS
ncbi:MAG: TolC family protein [Nitrospiraceae bacterium]